MKKKTFLNLMVIVFFATAFTLVSCNDDDTTEEETTTTTTTTTTLSGDYSEDLTLSADTEYDVQGEVIIKSGATLTIEEGVTIYGDASVISYILIEQGAKIEAEGTADNPIVMTSETEEAGAWGGLHICGYAPINTTSGTGDSEIGDATYGGDDSDDNSGTLRYIRLEYTGAALDTEHESNGVSFYGVGSGTTVEYIQVYDGADDGFEFFGGTVNVKYLVSSGSQDDSFDWTEGWSGKGQYLLAIQNDGSGDRGIEGDNNGNDNTSEPFASPILSQVTLIGGYTDDSTAGKYGMKLREGTKGEFYNIVVTGFDKRSIHVEHNQTLTNVNNDDLIVDYAYVNNDVTDAAIKYSVSTVEVGGEEVSDPDGPSVDEDKKFESSDNITLTEVSVDASATYSGGYDMSSDSFFTSDSKIGSGNDWATSWTK